MNVNDVRRKNLLALGEGMKRKDLAAKIDVPYGQLNHWIGPNPYRNIGNKIARQIEDAFQKPEGWLDQLHDNVVGEHIQRYSQDEATPDNMVALTKEQHDLIAVRVMEAEASMGPGRELVASDTVVGKMEISRDWVRRNLPSVQAPGKLAVITAYGDSMEPTFKDGDILLVDRGVGEVKLDAVYVLGRQDQLFVKRVQRRLNGDLVIKSDNPLFENEVVQGDNLADVRVLGRVVWSWNGRRL